MLARAQLAALACGSASALSSSSARWTGGVGGGRVTRDRSVSRYERDGLLFVRDLLPAAAFSDVCNDVRRLRSALKPEKGSMAVGRRGRVLDSRNDAHQLLSSAAVAKRVNQLIGSPARPLVPSEYPIELRVYPVGSSMDWHVDDMLYDTPQCEMVLVLENSSDSQTEWLDASGELHAEWTPPNSALLVRAGGARHRVRPLKRGERRLQWRSNRMGVSSPALNNAALRQRASQIDWCPLSWTCQLPDFVWPSLVGTILKMVWTVEGASKVDGFFTHLDSMPGLRNKQRPKRGRKV